MNIPICILSFNHPQITARAIQSCLQFSLPAMIRVLHNGSHQQHRDALKLQFPHVQHWVLEENRGFTGGANEIFRRSFDESPWIFFLTNDCELLSIPNVPLVPGFYGVKTWARKIGQVDSCLGKIDLATARISHRKMEMTTDPTETLKSSERLYVHGAAFYLHRDVYSKVGLLDENLGTYCEDIDYSLRVSRAGYPVGLAPQTEVLHHIGKTCRKDPLYTTYFYQRNRRRICLRYCPAEYRMKLKWHLFIENWKTRVRLALRGKLAQRQLFEKALKDV